MSNVIQKLCQKFVTTIVVIAGYAVYDLYKGNIIEENIKEDYVEENIMEEEFPRYWIMNAGEEDEINVLGENFDEGYNC